MATSFNTQTGGGEYHLQFETTDRDKFLFMQEAARRCVDGPEKTAAGREALKGERGMSGANNTRDLCRRCAEEMKHTHKLCHVKGGVDFKITCSCCGRRRYGATYELVKK